jgi:glucose/arabinose dehydrogenase
MTDKSKYPDAVDAVWSSGSPTVATSGLDFLSGSQWRGWDVALAVACLRGARLLVMQLNEAGDAIVGEETILSGTFGRLRTPMQGPDGFLYVTTSNGGGNDVIIRIRPS